MSTPHLFDRIVAESGLAPIIAPYAIRRMLVRANVVPPEKVSPEELRRVLGTLAEGLSIYLSGDERERAIRSLHALAGEQSL